MKGKTMRLAHITRTLSGSMTSRGICQSGEVPGYHVSDSAEWVVYPLRDDETPESVSWGDALRRAAEVRRQ